MKRIWMNIRGLLPGVIAVCLTQSIDAAPPPSSYAGQESRGVKALSTDEVAALLEGRGMGLAKAAELNGYPGPAHVMELANELHLTAEQRKHSEALFASMQAAAIAAGRELIEAERTLDRLFADRTATPKLVSDALAKIGQLQARVREVHLDAHLEQAQVLTHDQNVKYAQMRGYGVSGLEAGHAPHHAH